MKRIDLGMERIWKANSSFSIDIGHIIAVNFHMSGNSDQHSDLFIILKRRVLILNCSRYVIRIMNIVDTSYSTH